MHKFKVGQLDISERKEILRLLLASRGKALDERAFSNDLAILATKRDAGNVKYLKLLADEMSKFGLFDELGSQLNKAGETSEKLLQQILARLEEDFGTDLVEDSLAILFVSKVHGGLSEHHLKLALNSLQGRSYLGTETIAPLKVSMLLSGLDQFLQPTRGGLSEGMIVLREKEFALTIEERYWKNDNAVLARMQSVLVSLFCSLYNDQHRSGHVDPIVIKIILSHLSSLSKIKEFEEQVCNIDFVFHAAAAGLISLTKVHLMGAFIVNKSIRSRFLNLDLVKAFTDFISKNEETLTAQPCLTLQLALNESPLSLVHKEAAKIVELKDGCPMLISSAQVLMTWQNRDDDSSSAVLASFRRFNTSTTLNVSAVESTPSIESDHLMAAHGFMDGSILLTLASTSDDLFSLIGHSSPITALEFLSGNKSSGDAFLVSGSQDGTISFWDLNSRIRLSSVKAHTKQVSGLAASIDGLTLVSVSYDGCIKVFGGRTRKESTEIKQEVPFTCVAHHPDKDFVITGSFDGLVKIWDLTKVERRAVLRGHKSSVQCVALSWDARNIASGSITGDIIIHDGTTGSRRAILTRCQAVYTLGFSSKDEDTVYVGCRTGEIFTWKFDNAKPIISFPFVEEPKRATALFIDQELKIGVGLDCGEIYWNVQHGYPEKMFKFKVSDNEIKSIKAYRKCLRFFTDVVQTSLSDMLDEDEQRPYDEVSVLLISTTTQAFVIAVDDNENVVKMFVELEGFSDQILETAMVGLTFVTAGNHGNLYMHQLSLDKQFFEDIATSNPPKVKPVDAFQAHKMNMAGFAVHPTQGWCITNGQAMIKVWKIAADKKAFDRLAAVTLDEPPISLAFTERYGKIFILAMSSTKLTFCHVNDHNNAYTRDEETQRLQPKLSIEITESFDLTNGEFRLETPFGNLPQNFACRDMNGVTVRSNKGSLLKRFAGNFGNAISLTKFGVNDEGYHLAVWDESKRELQVYDILRGWVDGSTQFSGFRRQVNHVATLGNKNSLFGSSKDNSLRIWKLSDQNSGDNKVSISGKVVSLVNVGDRVLALTESGNLSEWCKDDNGSWKSDSLINIQCKMESGCEKMTSLAAITVPAPDNITDISGTMIAVTCAKHCQINLFIRTKQRISRLRVIKASGDANGTKEVPLNCNESTPLSCALSMDKQVQACLVRIWYIAKQCDQIL